MDRKSLTFTLALALAPALTSSLDLRADAVAPLGTTYHVSTTGSNANPGTPGRPFRTVDKAVEVAQPGDSILVHAGSYSGVLEIKRSGRPSAPITLVAAEGGPVTLTANHPDQPCSNSSPTHDRTVQIINGADDWVVKGFNVVGGVLVSGTKTGTLDRYIDDLWRPGRSSYDPVAADLLLPSLGIDPADRVQILENDVRGRGIQAVAARHGKIAGNQVHAIECGTGAGILLSRFSDGWTIRNNRVHHNEKSVEHPMEEGIRINGASNYNLIEQNTAEDLVGRGRGFSTDVHASWNVFRVNVARRTDQGFNQQTGGTGNQWLANTAENVRSFGFNLDGKDSDKTNPDDEVPANTILQRNCSRNNPEDLNVGAVQTSVFKENGMRDIRLSDNVRSYWRREGNTWEGGSSPPNAKEPGQRWCE